MATAVLSGTLAFVGTNSQSRRVPVACNAVYAALSEGIIDIPDETADAAPFDVPFGAISVNTNNLPIGVRTNAAVSDEFEIPAGDSICIVAPTAVGLTSCVVTTTAIQVGAGTVEYTLLGA
jgi:hypothetical protein